jgi:hypothetical protein
MKLKSLEIELQWYGEFSGQYVGKVEFQDEKANRVAMTLPPEVSNIVLAALGDNLAKITQRTADELAVNIRKSIEEVKRPALTAVTTEVAQS